MIALGRGLDPVGVFLKLKVGGIDMNRISGVAAIVFALAAGVMTAAAQQCATGEQIERVFSELQRIRLMLENNPSSRPSTAVAARASVNIRSAPSIGVDSAPASIIEFMDFQCPYCKRFYTQAFKYLKEQYIDSGKVRFYVIEYPLATHPKALLAAQAGRCASDQVHFWPMFNALELDSATLDADQLDQLAKSSGLEGSAFQECVASRRHEQEILAGVREATSKGIHGTPTFIVGTATTKDIVEGELVIGAVPLGVLQSKINAILDPKSAPVAAPTTGGGKRVP